jgi:hypothetical protein
MKHFKNKQKGKAGKTGNFRWYSTIGILLLGLCFAGNASGTGEPKQICIVCPPDNQMKWINVYTTNDLLPGVTEGDLCFDSDRKLVLQWTGENWATLWFYEPPKGVVVIPPVVDESGNKVEIIGKDGENTETRCIPPPLRFMAYNLGADRNINTPKAQMKYLADNYAKYAKVAPTRDRDAKVLRGLYTQWGREGDKYTISESGNEPYFIRFGWDTKPGIYTNLAGEAISHGRSIRCVME